MAILGFKNATLRQDRNWVSQALAEALTSELAAGGQLKTVSQENVARLKSDLGLGEGSSYSTISLRRIYDSSGSDYVVTGSYLSIGDQIRLDINVQDTFRGEQNVPSLRTVQNRSCYRFCRGRVRNFATN